jgi:hypothetical protein
VIVSHGALLKAFHCNVEVFVVIENDPLSPVTAAFADEGLMLSTPPA